MLVLVTLKLRNQVVMICYCLLLLSFLDNFLGTVMVLVSVVISNSTFLRHFVLDFQCVDAAQIDDLNTVRNCVFVTGLF